MSRNFVATVKERRQGESCYVLLELHEDIGLGRKLLKLNLPDGTGYEDAKRMSSMLNEQVSSLGIE